MIPQVEPLRRYYTPQGAAELLSVSPRQIYRWLASGLLDAVPLPTTARNPSRKSRRKPGQRITGESIAKMLAPVK